MKTVKITITTYGSNADPEFDIYDNVDPGVVRCANVSLADLIAGFDCDQIDDNATQVILVGHGGVCDTTLPLDITECTTTTTTTVAPTTTTTTTIPPTTTTTTTVEPTTTTTTTTDEEPTTTTTTTCPIYPIYIINNSENLIVENVTVGVMPDLDENLSCLTDEFPLEYEDSTTGYTGLSGSQQINIHWALSSSGPGSVTVTDSNTDVLCVDFIEAVDPTELFFQVIAASPQVQIVISDAPCDTTTTTTTVL